MCGPVEISARSMSHAAHGLRAWAHGMYAVEAAVELLIRFESPFGSPLLTGPWIQYDPESDHFWFDAEVVDGDGCLSSGERRVLWIAASLADPVSAPVCLGDALPGLDREALELVLAAVAHAGGSHEHSRLIPDVDGPWLTERGVRLATQRLGSLYDWPQEES